MELFSHLRHSAMLPSLSGMCKPLYISAEGWGIQRDCCGGVCDKLKYNICCRNVLGSRIVMIYVSRVWSAQSSELASVAGKFAKCCHRCFFVVQDSAIYRMHQPLLQSFRWVTNIFSNIGFIFLLTSVSKDMPQQSGSPAQKWVSN
jgi:hypothetical protein